MKTSIHELRNVVFSGDDPPWHCGGCGGRLSHDHLFRAYGEVAVEVKPILARDPTDLDNRMFRMSVRMPRVREAWCCSRSCAEAACVGMVAEDG